MRYPYDVLPLVSKMAAAHLACWPVILPRLSEPAVTFVTLVENALCTRGW